MKRTLTFLLALGAALPAAAVNLDMVQVAAPAINCKFQSTCKMVANDSVANFTLPGTSGKAFLQSRTSAKGQAGTAAAGLTPYEYRLDLTQPRLVHGPEERHRQDHHVRRRRDLPGRPLAHALGWCGYIEV
jgi:hypothetical protein